MGSDTEIQVRPESVPMEMSVDDITARLKKIQAAQRGAMDEGIDYGVIPGTGSKPTLFKAGAEKLCVLFRLDAQFESQSRFEGRHLTVTTTCIIYHQVSGQRLGGANAMCSSEESKYKYRKQSRLCPRCGKEAIIKGRAEYGGRWVCFKKKNDGCGAKFDDNDPAITSQPEGRVENEDVADQFPTVMRMAEKRALIAAVRLVTGASAIFDEPMSEDDTPPPPKGDEGPPLASEEQRVVLMRSARNVMGKGEADKWIVAKMEAAGIKTKAQITVANIEKWTLDIIEFNPKAEHVEPIRDSELR